MFFGDVSQKDKKGDGWRAGKLTRLGEAKNKKIRKYGAAPEAITAWCFLKAKLHYSCSECILSNL